MTTDHEPKVTDSKLSHQPPHGWLWESLTVIWHRKTTVIAALCVLAIVLHLLLRFAFQVSPIAYQLPLLATLVLGGLPLLYELLKKLFRREFGSDLLGGISIITSVLLGEYLAGSIIVLMLAGGESLESYALAAPHRCWPRWRSGCQRLPTGRRRVRSPTWLWRMLSWEIRS